MTNYFCHIFCIIVLKDGTADDGLLLHFEFEEEKEKGRGERREGKRGGKGIEVGRGERREGERGGKGREEGRG